MSCLYTKYKNSTKVKQVHYIDGDSKNFKYKGGCGFKVSKKRTRFSNDCTEIYMEMENDCDYWEMVGVSRKEGDKFNGYKGCIG